MIHQYLEDLENRIDPAVEEALLSQWKRYMNGGLKSGFFSPARMKTTLPQVAWPAVSVNETLEDNDLMALQQLSDCSAALNNGTGAIMTVRANYGTGILSSVFGAELFVMADRYDTLPTTRPLEGGADAMKRLLDNGIPDLNAGLGERCFAMGRHYIALFADYPSISKYVMIYHPDLQGPMDICELLWGSDLFYALIDTPELVHAVLELITETYITFMRKWESIVPPRNGYSPHWGMLHKGRIMIRDDSAMNLSPEMFDEFIKPYDQRLLDKFGGGAIHFCGRGDHYIDRMHTMPGVYAVNMSQPEYNDMERIYQNTVDKGLALIQLRRATAEAAVQQGRDLHGLAHCSL